MVSSISSLSASALSLLFTPTNTAASTLGSNTQTNSSRDVTGYTDDVFKAGDAIGKIIDIVSGMNAKTSIGMFSMDGATRIDGVDGQWSMTKTGTGKVGSDAELEQRGLDSLKEQAAGSGPDADFAKAYLKAAASGTLQTIDLSTKGVSATLTRTVYYNPDGSQRGESDRYHVQGLDEFLKANTYVDPSGYGLRDRETGRYASITQNGTHFNYVLS